jgi:hypothetical protein
MTSFPVSAFAGRSKKFEDSVRFLSSGPGCALLAMGLASCSIESGTGYIEIKSIPPCPLVALYLDTVKRDPLRNGNVLLRHRVGVSKPQTEGEGGYLEVLCSIDVKKNRITSVTVSATNRAPRCQCARTGGTDATGSRTCIG